MTDLTLTPEQALEWLEGLRNTIRDLLAERDSLREALDSGKPDFPCHRGGVVGRLGMTDTEYTKKLIHHDIRTYAEKKLDAMLDDEGAWEQGNDPYRVLYRIAARLLEDNEKFCTRQELLYRKIGDLKEMLKADETLLRQALKSLEQIATDLPWELTGLQADTIAALRERLGKGMEQKV